MGRRGLGHQKTDYKLADGTENSGIIKTEGKKFYAEVYLQNR